MQKLLKNLPFQAVLTIPFLIILMVSVGLTGYISFRNGEESVKHLTSHLLHEVAARVHEYLDHYLDIPHQINQSNIDRLKLDQLSVEDKDSLQRHFLSQIQQYPSVVEIAYADEQREFIGAEQKVLGYDLTIGKSNASTEYALEEYIYKDDETPLERFASVPNYDPRPRPWYQAAVLAKKETWTPVYMWSLGAVGLDSVAPVYDETGKLLGVLDVALTLDGIGSYLSSLPDTFGGQIFIMERSGILVASSVIQEPYFRKEGDLQRMSALEADDPIIRTAAQYMKSQPGELAGIKTNLQFSFDAEKVPQIAEVYPYSDKQGLDWLIVTVIPESYFMAQINDNNRSTAFLIMASLVASIIFSTLVAGWVIRPIVTLNKFARALARGEWSQKLSIDRPGEVGELSESFNLMSEQLKASFAQIQSSETRYRTLFEASADANLLISDGIFVDCNESALRLLEAPRDYVVGHRPDEISPPFQPDGIPSAEKALTKIERAMKTTSLKFEWVHRRPNGVDFWVEVVLTRIYLNDKMYLYTTWRDITDRKKAETQITHKFAQLSTLKILDIAIVNSDHLSDLFSVFLEQISNQLFADAIWIILRDQISGALTNGACYGFSTLPIIDDAASQSGLNTLMKGDLSIISEDTAKISGIFGENFESFAFAASIPLATKNSVVGLLTIFRRKPFSPDADWLRFLEALAGQTAIGIERINLVENLRLLNQSLSKAYDATIEGWANALELRDKETEGHSRRVAQMTLGLARAVGVPEETLDDIYRGALLHDIGKMTIPDQILLKNGPLTSDEWELMRQHPEIAYQLLKNITFLEHAIDIPYGHHEHWDGRGYPRGLSGEDIPLSARIFALADVWDALCSDRPYRKAWTKQQTLAYILERSGKQFDPRLVSAFKEMILESAEQNENLAG